VIPCNEGRGYVLRRIIRRAVRHLRELGIKEVTLHRLVPTVFEILGDTYSENKKNQSLAQKFLELEEKKFLETLDQGLRFLHEGMNQVQQGIFPGALAFQLYDTCGFPLDLTEVILREQGIKVDVASFNNCMKKQQDLSRKSWKGQQFTDQQEELYVLLHQHGPTKFLGYETLETESQLLKIFAMPSAAVGKDGGCNATNYALIFKSTPFYAESGGQVADKGEIWAKLSALQSPVLLGKVYDVKKPIDGLWVHYLEATEDGIAHFGNFAQGKLGQCAEELLYCLRVNANERELIKRNHSATHLLHRALALTLGNHVKQAGSSVSSEKLRFDFTHFSALSKDELSLIQNKVNAVIKQKIPVTISCTSRSDAEKMGAVALFGEKYREEVRVVQMGDFSMELCGGIHVKNSSEIEYFSILSESALSSGVRRIEAITSSSAIQRLEERSEILEFLEGKLKLVPGEIYGHILHLRNELKSLEKEKCRIKEKLQQIESESVFSNQELLKGDYCFKSVQIDADTDLRKFSDLFVDKFKRGILFAYTLENVTTEMAITRKFSVILRTHKENSLIDCASILKNGLTSINGKGGGRRDMAQGSAEIECEEKGTKKSTDRSLVEVVINNLIQRIKNSILEVV
ncbi:MAG: hypothetical protein HQK53_13870, partial [Oligoflexia bacterium]|nr:hypothetical protein [Oligoflexia bacterium]